MAIELQQLIDKVDHMDITQLAGYSGMHNMVSWVHMVETPLAAEFLTGGELALITGTGLAAQGKDLFQLVSHIYEKQASGIFINTGPFIEEVSEEIISFCNEKDFPLFTIPWRVHLAELMRVFCFEITRQQQQISKTAAAFENAIFFPLKEELYIVPLSQQGFQADWTYSVCMICLRNPSGEYNRRLEQISESISAYASHKYDKFVVFCHNREIIIVTADYTQPLLREFITDIHSHALRCLVSGETLTIGCGRLTRSIRCLYKSYNQANSIQKLQARGKIDPDLIFYPDMGLFQILMSIEDREIILEYYNKTIKPLVLYDKKNGSDLTAVLRCYLDHDGSVKETAEKLYVHRNTINYKLGKISEILGMDLSRLSSRLELSVGFMLEDML